MEIKNTCLVVFTSLLLISNPRVAVAQDSSGKSVNIQIKVKVTLEQRPREADLPIETGEIQDGSKTVIWVKAVRAPKQSQFKLGDVLLSLNKQQIESLDQYRQILQNSFVGSRATLTIRRKGQGMTLTVPLLARRRKGMLGVAVTEKEGKVTLGEILEDSAAKEGGLKKGDHLTFIESSRISSIDDVIRALKNSREGDRKTVTVRRDGKTIPSTMILGPAPVPPFLGIIYNQNADKPLVISEVVKLSPAEKVGLKAGDVVTSINDQQLTNSTALTEILEGVKPGDVLSLVVTRKTNKRARLY
jgi:S1-C subfamily serine protease